MGYQSFFGVQGPKFIYDKDGGSEDEVLLDYAVDIDESIDPGSFFNESIINRHREWKDKGDHYIYKCRYNLYKHDEVLAGSSKTMYDKIWGYRKELVTFWRRRDANQFKDSDGNDVLFRLDVEIDYYKTSRYEDTLILTFTSQDPVDISKCAIGAGSSS